MVFLKLERFQEALSAIEHDRRSGTSFALREDLRGDALYGVGRHKEAMVAYRRALKLLPDNPLLESKLGYTEVKLGHKNAGLARLRHAAEAVPELHPVNDRLMKACIMAGRLEEAADVAEKYTQIVGHPKLFLRAASIRARLKQWGRAQEIILRGLQLFPESENLQTAHAEVSSKCCNSISRDAKSDADPPTREAAAVTSAH
jgi:tetratricopeptide (TPR) repeat protein